MDAASAPKFIMLSILNLVMNLVDLNLATGRAI